MSAWLTSMYACAALVGQAEGMHDSETSTTGILSVQRQVTTTAEKVPVPVREVKGGYCERRQVGKQMLRIAAPLALLTNIAPTAA